MASVQLQLHYSVGLARPKTFTVLAQNMTTSRTLLLRDPSCSQSAESFFH